MLTYKELNMKTEIEKLMTIFAQLGMTEHLTDSERSMVETLVTQTVKNAIWETKKAAEETMNQLYKSC